MTLEEYSKKGQLCWYCKNSIDGCSWSKYGNPVDGWNAIPTQKRALSPSFMILECPEYIEE